MRPGFVEIIHEALARWMLGDIGAAAALEAVCAVVEPCEVSATLVRQVHDTPDRIDVGGHREDLAFARIALLSGDHRRLFTPQDACWRAIFAGRALSAEPAWAACEPVVDVSGAAIVAIGRSDVHQHEVLDTLPLLARASARILFREQAARTAATLRHALNNLLASVVGNVEYAADLLQNPDVDPPLLASATPEHRTDIIQAMQYARQAANEMGAHVGQISELVRDGST